jgi:hypothetical protein
MIPDYEGFGKHVAEWNEAGVPYGRNELVELAVRYGTPIPGTPEWTQWEKETQNHTL